MQKFQYEWYDCIIMGDVIEHMTPKEGVRCYYMLIPRCTELVIAVPYFYAQGACMVIPMKNTNNQTSPMKFLWNDITALRFFLKNDGYGYYIKVESVQGI